MLIVCYNEVKQRDKEKNQILRVGKGPVKDLLRRSNYSIVEIV
jgi:hypothetical protein